jgi:Phage T4 tail fibre
VTLENVAINGTLVAADITGDVSDNIIGDLTGNVTGKLFPATNGSISNKFVYDIVYDVNGPNIEGFTSHYFNCNANLVFAINQYSVNSTKPFYCLDTVYSTGIKNSTNAITNNSTLAQVGTSTFTGAITANAGFQANSQTAHYCLGGHNYFDSSAITSPKVNNGIATGNADGASTSVFNNAINSWYGTGFIDTCNKACNAVINHRTGEFFTNGNITSNGVIYTPIISGTNGLELTTTTTTGIHNFKIYGDQKV